MLAASLLLLVRTIAMVELTFLTAGPPSRLLVSRVKEHPKAAA